MTYRYIHLGGLQAMVCSVIQFRGTLLDHNDDVTYLASFGFLRQDVNFKNAPKGFTQYDLRLNLDAKINDFLSMDVGLYSRSFEAGMVLTCEPGIYIPEEGIGCRLENDYLLTSKGNINLTGNMPIEIADIERLMAEV